MSMNRILTVDLPKRMEEARDRGLTTDMIEKGAQAAYEAVNTVSYENVGPNTAALYRLAAVNAFLAINGTDPKLLRPRSN